MKKFVKFDKVIPGDKKNCNNKNYNNNNSLLLCVIYFRLIKREIETTF